MTYSTISFPSLGIELNPGYGFDIGPLSVRYYGMILAFGILLACIYGLRRGKEFGLTQDDILDGALMIIPFAIICARAYYCIFAWHEFKANPIEVLYIWKGGIAIYGGVIGAAIGITVYCLCKKIPIATALDITAVSFLIGQAIGRWGNFFNREAFGAQTESFLRMGLQHATTGAVTYHHPTFLYESVWNAIGFVILHFASKRRKYDGQVALGYVAWYGLGRCFIEGLRTDSLYWGPFRVSQVLAAISCFAAVAVLIAMTFRPHDPAKLYVNRVAAMEAAKAAEEKEEEAIETVAETAEETEE
ncbi:MAG: prolipoprotein diacylglyceryl transferase [Oscillospiraceae bacterium]|nr:prolipoprotein diacylglyceryl transferase [Oscillospiraceae bacterium]